MTPSKEERIQRVLDSFSFEKVHKIMLLLNWVWFPYGRVPYEHELRAEATRILSEVFDSPENSPVSHGGLRAFCGDDDLGLEFVPVEIMLLYDEESGEFHTICPSGEDDPEDIEEPDLDEGKGFSE